MLWFPLWLKVALGLWAAVVGLLYYFFTYHFDYWKKKGVVFEKGYPLVGSLPGMMTFKEHMMLNFDKLYKKYKGERFVGYYQGRSPALLVLDPDLIKRVLVKDFAHFHDRGFRFHEEADPLQARNLFCLEGQKWKQIRSSLSPTFTSGKMKMMTPLIEEIAQDLVSHLTERAESKQAFEITDIFSRFSNDVISSCIFGMKGTSIENPENEFRRMGKKLLKLDFWRGIKTMTIMFLPDVGIFFRLAIISKEATNFFRKVVSDMMESRKKSGRTRKDFMQLLIELKEKGRVAVDSAEDEKEIKELNAFSNTQSHTNSIALTLDDLTSQATVFFLVGFDTATTVTGFACLEMAVNNEIKRKAQLDIDEALSNHGGKLNYEALKEMKYLECIIQETLRKYPPSGMQIRACTKNYTIPGTEILIEKGVFVAVPSYSLQMDPEYFPDPENFNPDRFKEENALHKYQFLHMPFGEGPRQCIGSRFAMLQLKMALAAIISKFDLSVCERTIFPAQIDPRQMVVAPLGGVWLQVQPRSSDE